MRMTFIRARGVRIQHMEPGEVIRTEIVINATHDMSQPDKYTIQLSERDFESKTPVRANTITVPGTP
jgi:hypothetical protein